MIDGARRKPAAAGDAADRRGHDAPFGMLVAVSIIGVLLHVLMDLPTSYGTRLLSPFDWHWFAVDWMPIVDIYLLVALASSVFSAVRPPAQRRAKAAVVLLLMATNYGVRAGGASSGAGAGAAAVRSDAAAAVRSAEPDDRARFVAAPPVSRRRRRGKAMPGRHRCAAVVHIAVQMADHRTDVERVRDSRHRPARSAFPRARERIGCSVAFDATLSECVDAGGGDGGGNAPRPGVSRIFALAGCAIGCRLARDDHRTVDRHALCRRHLRARPTRSPCDPVHGDRTTCRGRAVCLKKRWASAAERDRGVDDGTVDLPRLGAHMSVAGGLPRAVERAVVHRCEALQIFAKNASQWRGRELPRRGNPRVSREAGGGRDRARRLARQLSDQPRHDQPGAAEPVDRGDGRRARPRGALGLLGVVLHPGCYTVGSEAEGLNADRGCAA